ncbi:hypothetical protein Tco_0571286 [Tanacetum coccineum]
MAQQQHQQIIPTDQIVPKFQSIERCNNYVVLKNIPCSVECKIVGQILIDHALSYALTATADVSPVYLQKFWKTVSKVVNTKDIIRFMLDKKEITYTVDMFRSTLQFQVETPDNPFIAPATIDYIQPFMKIVGYQGEVDKWDFLYCVQQKKDQIQYPRFTKLIIADLMKKFQFLNYLKRSIVLSKMIFCWVGVPTIQPQPVKSTQGTIRTPSAHRTPTLTTIAGDVVQKKRKRKQTAGETSSPKPSLKIHVKQFKLSTTPIPLPSDDNEREEESYASEFVDSVFQDDDDDSGNRIEPRSHKEHPETIDDDDVENEEEKKDEKKDDDNDDDVKDDHTNHTLDKTQETELTDTVSLSTATTSQGQSKTRRISSKYTHIPQALHKICKHQDIMIKQIEKKFVTNCDFHAIHKNVDNIFHDVIPKIALNATNDIIEDNLLKVIVEAVMKERDTFKEIVPALISKEIADHAPKTNSSTATPSSTDVQHQLYLKVKKSLEDQADDPKLWEVLKCKFEKCSASPGPCRIDTFRGS